MRRFLLIGWVATLGVTRVDLLGGAAAFQLTPFLALSPLVLAFELAAVVARGGTLRVPRGLAGLALAITLLLSLILLSSALSADLTLSVRRALLLCVQLALVLLVVVGLANHADARGILVRGAYGGVALFLAFNVLQVVSWFTGFDGGAILSLEARDYAGIIPRLSGAAFDPNPGGLLLVVYLYVALRLGSASRLRTALVVLGVASVALTISRSAILAALTTLAFALFEHRRVGLSRGRVLAVSAALAAVLLVLVASPRAMESVGGTAELLSGRLSFQEGSSSEHATVTSRGIEVGTASVKQTLIGIGYGNAYLMLQDVFPGEKYGNFHSLFVTFFAESGVFAAALMLGIMGYALTRRSEFRPLIAGLLVYNLVQQTQTEPAFWLILALACTSALGPAAPISAGGAAEPSRPASAPAA
jgi:hypothetical protein